MEKLTVNRVEYRILKLLGHGKGGYSYLAEKDGRQYVLKQIHHEPCAYYTFGNKIEAEANDYERLLRAGIRVPRLLDIDYTNERIIKEFIDGPTVRELVENDMMKPAYMDQVRQMAAAARAAGLNIDYYPTNFVVQNEVLFYIDYECNTYEDKWSFENWGLQYWVKEAAQEQDTDIVAIFIHFDGKDAPDALDDYQLFWFYRAIFDKADSFRVVSCEDIAGGTDRNGITKIVYSTDGGKKLYLEIDGGFPVPELAVTELHTDNGSKELVGAIIAAFEQYFETKISHYTCQRTAQNRCALHLYA